jgi:hypothetical protein
VAATARMWASWAVTGSSFGEPTEFSTPAQSGGTSRPPGPTRAFRTVSSL